MFGDMNNKPFQHTSHNGTEFNAEFCDLRNGVKVTNPNKNIALYTQDVAEFAAFHALLIRPELNGFAGYDAISYEIESQPEKPSIAVDVVLATLAPICEVLDNVRDNINPERGYSEELEQDVASAFEEISSFIASCEQKI